MVGVFPDPAAPLRLAGAVLVGAHEWQVSERRYLAEGSTAALLTPPTEEVNSTR